MNHFLLKVPTRGATAWQFTPKALTALAFACAATWSLAGVPVGHKLDIFTQRASREAASDKQVELIVKTAGELTQAQRKRLTALKARVTKNLDLISSYAMVVPQRNVEKLAALPFVARVSFDTAMQKNDEFTVERSFADVAFAKQGLTGKGVTVAVMDSGFGDHPDLRDPATGKSRILASVNFVPFTSSTADTCGHGTHVAGIVAGNGAESSKLGCFRTFYGIARKANLVNVRVLDTKGSTKVSTVVQAIEWVIANRATYKIKVLNMSLGHAVGESYKTDPLCVAVEKAWKAGITVVVAAGNEGRTRQLNLLGDKSDNEGYGTAYGSIASPGNSPYVITVGSMKSNDSNRANDTVSTYSSRGPARLDFVLKPDIVAPGNQVVSLRKPLSFLELTSLSNSVPMSSYSTKGGLLGQSDYFKLSGTSMAAPVVAGAVALMLEDEPSLTPDSIKARLMLTADKWLDKNGEADMCTFGSGYLDITEALTSTFIAKKPALSPQLAADEAGNVTMDLDPTVEGERALWGSTVSDLRAVWGTRAIWGSNTLNGSRALWGSSVWADRAMWGSDLFTIGIGPILLLGE